MPFSAYDSWKTTPPGRDHYAECEDGNNSAGCVCAELDDQASADHESQLEDEGVERWRAGKCSTH